MAAGMEKGRFGMTGYRMGLAALLAAALSACGGPAAKPAAPVPQQAAAAAPAEKAPEQAAPAAAPENARACPPEPQVPSQEAMQDYVQHARDHGFLWRITKGGHSSYLYGTMHVGKPEWMIPGPQTMAALRATDTMALEMDLLDPQVQAQMQQALTSTHGAALPPALAARVQKEAEALCVPWQGVAGMPPELQLAVLEVAAGRWAGLDAAYAADAVLAGVGHGAHKQMVSLESPASQIHALMMKTPAETASYVEDTLKELESAEALALLKRLAQAWADSDFADIESYRQWCQCERTPAERGLMKRMLDQRNPAMAAKIDALHKKGGKVFAAVGSLHMVGAGGLPALLKKKGYKVERIAFAPVSSQTSAPAQAPAEAH